MYEIEFRSLVKNSLEIETVDWGVNPDGVHFPAALMYLATELNSHDFDGPVSLKKALVRVDIWSETIGECIQLKNKLRTLDGFRGNNVISNIFLNGISQEKHTTDSFTVHQYSLDFWIIYNC